MRRRLIRRLLVVLGCSACLGAALQPPVEEPNEFHFVVLGDAQFHDPVKFNRVIDQARRLRPAFVIQVGDLIEGYNDDLDEVRAEWQRFADQVAPLGPVRFLPVPGNHDVYNAELEVDARLERLFEEVWGPLYFSFVYKNALLVGLNTDSSDGGNQIAGEQLTWLERTLAGSSAQHKFVFMHRPPQLTANAQALHRLFKQHGVSHVFYGHLHHYHFFERDGIAYTMTNAAATSAHDAEAVGSFHHLLQVSVRGAEVDVAVIEADSIKPQNAVYPQDNMDFFLLTRRLAPDNVALQRIEERVFELEIPLHNASEREIDLLISCASADQRWRLTPAVIAPMELASDARQTLTLRATFDAGRVPESKPVCRLRVPFQTAHGEWIDFEHEVRAVD